MSSRSHLKWAMGLAALALLTGCEQDYKPEAGNPAAARSEINFSAMGASMAGIPAAPGASMAALEDYIRSQAHNEPERAYGVYRWVRDNIQPDYALAATNFDPATQDPANVFSTHKAVCTGYAQLFVQLCQLAGLDAQTVGGYGVVTTYDRNAPGSGYNHLWSAVAIEGRWHLVEPSWSTSARLDGSSDPNFFFLTDPHAFVHRHFPYDTAWQFLDPPVPEKTFWDTLAAE